MIIIWKNRIKKYTIAKVTRRRGVNITQETMVVTKKDLLELKKILNEK